MFCLSCDEFTMDLPDDRILRSDKLQSAHISASRALARLDGMIASLPDKNLLIDAIPLQESEASCRIENIVTSHDDLFTAMVAESGPSGQAAREVLGYRTAIRNACCSDITIDSIEDACSTLRGEGVRIRKGSEEVSLVNPSTGEIVYTPPKGDVAGNLLEDLVAYMNWKGCDPLVSMAASHSAFESIHPFDDGNGRTGRVLMMAMLCRHGLLSDPVIFLSRYLLDNRREYYRHLSRTREKGRWEDWLAFVFKGIEETSRRSIEQIVEIRQLYADISSAHHDERFYSKELMDIIFSKVYCKVGTLVDAGICERNTASKYLRSMESMGILESEKVGREVIYKNTGLIDILSR